MSPTVWNWSANVSFLVAFGGIGLYFCNGFRPAASFGERTRVSRVGVVDFPTKLSVRLLFAGMAAGLVFLWLRDGRAESGYLGLPILLGGIPLYTGSVRALREEESANCDSLGCGPER